MGEMKEPPTKLVRRLTTATDLLQVGFSEDMLNEHNGMITIFDVLGEKQARYRASTRQLGYYANETNSLLMAPRPATYTSLTGWFDQHLPRIA